MSRSFYYVNQFTWDKFKEICRREGCSTSEKLSDFITNYVFVHDAGNPQTRISSYGDFKSADSLAQIEGKLRQDSLSYARKHGSEIRLSQIMAFAKELIKSSKTRMALVERTYKWLKDQEVKVWR